MLKYIAEFLATGAIVVVSYVLYFVVSFLTVVLIGLPIGFAIKLIIDVISLFYGGTPNANV